VGLIAQELGAHVLVLAESATRRLLLDALGLPHASLDDKAVNGIELDVLVDLDGDPRLEELFVRQSSSGARAIVMTSGGGSTRSTSIERLPIYGRRLTLTHSFHSDLDDRPIAATYLPRLSRPIRILSRGMPLDAAQEALKRVATRQQLRCHLEL
jgi:hypothetical protein